MILGCDPSRSYLGVGIIGATPGEAVGHVAPPLHALRRIRPGERPERAVQAICELANQWKPQHWAVEVVPLKLPKGAYPSHRSGAGPAWWGGVVAGIAYQRGQDVREVQVIHWRDQMRELNRRWGGPPLSGKLKLPAVRTSTIQRTERVDDNLVRLYRSCGHHHEVARSMLLAGLLPSCPECHASGRLLRDAKRDRHKEAACLFVEHHWPETYHALVKEAQAGARTDKPDHQLEGVADACEAVGVACGLLTTTHTAEAA